MIVDDHVLFAEAIGAALREAGMGVCASVTNGREAIAFLETDHADVVLMDIGLPDRSGLAVGREMLERWQGTHPEIETVELVIDPQLDPMACFVETELGRIEVGLSAQLEAVRTTLSAVAVEPAT